MNTNENTRNEVPEHGDVIVLGVASVETKGAMGPIEPGGGPGLPATPGISEE